MARKREKPEDIVMKLRQVEVLQGQGMSVAEAVRQVGMAQQTYYRWRVHYNTVRPHSALGYRPPAPESVIPMDQRHVMH